MGVVKSVVASQTMVISLFDSERHLLVPTLDHPLSRVMTSEVLVGRCASQRRYFIRLNFTLFPSASRVAM